MKNRSGEKIKLASIDELLGVVNEESAMEIEISKIINVNIKMYIFDHLRMYIFAILPLDRYIFLSDKIFL